MNVGQYFLSAGVCLLAALFLLYQFFPWIRYDIRELRVLLGLLTTAKNLGKKGMLIYDIFEEKVDATPKKTFLIMQDTDEHYSYECMDKQMNKLANAAMTLGVKKGDVVAMLMVNEPAFIWTFYGLGKIGVKAALLNYNLRSKSLLHCLTVSEAKLLIVSADDNLIKAVEEIYSDLQSQGVKVVVSGSANRKLPDGFSSLDETFAAASHSRPGKHHRTGIGFRDTMCYIYTSGTTGLPKAAVVAQDKGIKGALLMTPANVNSDDIIYTALPLYHAAAGAIALGTVAYTGSTLVLRSKFSASQFMADCRKYKVTVIQYIGELCRYLCAQPGSPDDKNHCIRLACGNGLRRDIWREFQDRFNIPVIEEFYGATEGNVIFINHMNKFGAIGRSSPLLQCILPAAFIKFDVASDEPVRNEKGFCVKVGFNEPGLCVGKIKKQFPFDGYKGTKDLSEKKILRNVFTKDDMYFNSGDLLEFDQDYFLYFNDRVGDTFRWKGENISTTEVANTITDINWIEDISIYGVMIEGKDGRAGMASMTLKDNHSLTEGDLEYFYAHCQAALPQYAWPRFLRVQAIQDMTATFKQRKFCLVKEGFDPSVVQDPLYCLDVAKKTYVQLTDDLYQKIIDGKILM